MKPHRSRDASMPRRKFLKLSAATVGAVGALNDLSAQQSESAPTPRTRSPKNARQSKRPPGRHFNSEYSGDYLNHVAFPLGGIGAGMLCLEGTGALSHLSLRNRPEVYNEPCVFAAVALK